MNLPHSHLFPTVVGCKSAINFLLVVQLPLPLPVITMHTVPRQSRFPTSPVPDHRPLQLNCKVITADVYNIYNT